MSLTEKKIVAVILAAVVVVLLVSQAVAGDRDNLRVYSAGEWSSSVVARVNISVSPTDIIVVKPDDADTGANPYFTVRLAISISKCESDFYAKINGITYSGAQYEYITWQRTDTSIPMTPHGCVLASDVDAPKLYTWYADFTFPAADMSTDCLTITLNLLSGKSLEASSVSSFSVPVNISYVSGLSIESAIEAGEGVQNRELYTPESLAVLDGAIESARIVLHNYASAEESDITAAVDAVYDAIAALSYKPADYSRIEALKLTIPELSMYSELSVTALNTVLEAIDYNKNITQQGEVDAYGYALEIAINGLYPAQFKLIASEELAIDEASRTVTVTQEQKSRLSSILTASAGAVRVYADTVEIVYNGDVVKTYSVTVRAA